MASINISPEKTVIDPRFDIPDGLDSFIYPDSETSTPSEMVGEVNVEESDIVIVWDNEQQSVEETESGEVTANRPPTPQQFTIVSQTIRMSPDGRQLVDVEIQVEDIPGVTQIDVRTTKT